MPSPLVAPITETLRDFGKPRINRAPSPTLAFSVPWLSVMLGSLSPLSLFITSAPLLPPLGLLLLLAWQQQRPGMFPVWAGLPLGLFDDLFSGQPFGSAVLLWSAVMIGLDLLEARLPWRGVALNWLVASGVVTVYLLLAALIAQLEAGAVPLYILAPQVAISILAYPVAAWFVGLLDRFRLIPIRNL
ncbi:MAG TPA: rod shape-determining protein MreD [Novosphingobium sp.]|nr:rod shape-determining protein MreD [Novosphingobium sp.]HQA17957.1 rod shape-determining protein MreD [Novosphingobium sp.]